MLAGSVGLLSGVQADCRAGKFEQKQHVTHLMPNSLVSASPSMYHPRFVIRQTLSAAGPAQASAAEDGGQAVTAGS
jgi:hypothetical protein